MKHAQDVLDSPVLIRRSNCLSFTVNTYLSIESLLNCLAKQFFSSSVLAWLDGVCSVLSQAELLSFVFCSVLKKMTVAHLWNFLKHKDDEHSLVLLRQVKEEI